MKIIIISDGKHGNGRNVAEEIMTTVKESGREAHIYSVEDTKPEKIKEGEFYIFVSPTHMRGPSGKMKKAIKKGLFQEGAGYGLITISKKQNKKTAKKMDKMLEKKGFSKKIPNLHLVEKKNGELKDDSAEKIGEFCEKIPVE